MYDELHNAWKAEKSSQKLQPLPRDFYQRTTAYLEGLSYESPDREPRDLQGRLTAREKDIVSRLLRELKEIRRTKIYQAAQNHSEINSTDLTEEEAMLVEVIKYPESGSRIPESIPSSSKLGAEDSLVVVRFLQDIPEVVGTDLRIYGPFKKEDVASVPSTNAKALIDQGAAKAIDFKKVEKDERVINE